MQQQQQQHQHQLQHQHQHQHNNATMQHHNHVQLQIFVGFYSKCIPFIQAVPSMLILHCRISMDIGNCHLSSVVAQGSNFQAKGSIEQNMTLQL
jgi:ABC-type Zn2+ transport system substrate-binding protein/surface adhesin